MALESPHVEAASIEAMEFPHLANRFGVRGVPKIIMNGFSVEGALPEDAFLKAVLSAGGVS